MTEKKPIISIRNVTKRFGSAVTAVDSVSLEIQEGEFFALLGPSGCGKSTVLRMIAGLEVITEGEIAINGEIVNQLEPADRDIAMVFQNYALYPHMTVAQNIGFPLKQQKVPKDEREKQVREAARILDLEDYLDRKPKQLSGGQRQRIAIARAILADPKILILDEATSALDLESEALIQDSLERLAHDRTTLVVAHRLSTITHADQILVIDNGQLAEQGTHDELLQKRGVYYKLFQVQNIG